MDNSLSHFKQALFRRKKRKEKQKTKFNKKNLDYIAERIKNESNFPKLTEAEMKILKLKIRKDARRHKLKELLIYMFLMILIFTLLLTLF